MLVQNAGDELNGSFKRDSFPDAVDAFLGYRCNAVGILFESRNENSLGRSLHKRLEIERIAQDRIIFRN